MKYSKLVVGIDPSYNRTGISIVADGKLVKVASINMNVSKNNTGKRNLLQTTLIKLLSNISSKAEQIECIIERIRLQSDNFINIDYIKSIGALNSVIVDIMDNYNIEVYSVDTRAWKAQVVGTSKPLENNKGIDPKKWPTIQWLIATYPEMEKYIIEKLPENTKRLKGVQIDKCGNKFLYNDDAADSAAIAMYGFIGDRDKLKLEH